MTLFAGQIRCDYANKNMIETEQLNGWPMNNGFVNKYNSITAVKIIALNLTTENWPIVPNNWQQ